MCMSYVYKWIYFLHLFIALLIIDLQPEAEKSMIYEFIALLGS